METQSVQDIWPQYFVYAGKVITGSAAGGMEEMQDMLNFCAEKGVEPMIEVVSMEKVNEAFERLLKNDVRYRFVVDVENAFWLDFVTAKLTVETCKFARVEE